MKTLSLCLWLLLLMNPNLAYTEEQGTSSGTETSEEEEPDCE